MYSGTSRAWARSKMDQNRLSSKNTPLVNPWTMAPLNPSWVTVRSSSSAAALGSGVGRAAKAANRSEWGGIAWGGGAVTRGGARVVGFAGQPPGRLCIQTLGQRRAMRDHLDIDARLVHLLEAE